MSRSLGLSITSRGTNAVVVRRGRVVWTGKVERSQDRPLAEEVRQLLSAIPKPLRRRTRVRAAIGPWASQVKQISDLPLITDRRLLEAVVRESASRLFLRTAHPLVTSSVELVAPGSVWAAAVEDWVLSAIAEGCKAEGMPLDCSAPAAVSILYAAPTEDYEFSDGSVMASVVRATNGRIETARRWRIIDEPAPPKLPPAAPALLQVEGAPGEYTAAYGAAVLPSREPLLIYPGAKHRQPAFIKHRMALAAACLAIAIIVDQALPAMAMRSNAEEAKKSLSRMIPEVQAALAAERELLEVTGALREHSRFIAERRSTIELLAVVAAALPIGSALQSVQSDSLGLTLAVHAPRVATVVPALQEIPGVISLSIQSPITRESIGGVEMERVALKIGLKHELLPATLSTE